VLNLITACRGGCVSVESFELVSMPPKVIFFFLDSFFEYVPHGGAYEGETYFG
jgi:hypothetical protein